MTEDLTQAAATLHAGGVGVTWSEILPIVVAVLTAGVVALFAWWRAWAADRTVRLEMFREASKLASEESPDRSHMQRAAGVAMFIRLVDDRFLLAHVFRRPGAYDDLVRSQIQIFLQYLRLVFGTNPPGSHKEGQLDYCSEEYLLIRDWINNRAPHWITSKLAFPIKNKFKMIGGKLEANEDSSDYADWMEATGGKPPY